MSQYVASRWWWTGLGLLVAVGMLTGGACPADSQFLPDDGTRVEADTTPLLEMVSPTTNITIVAGVPVSVRWIDSDVDSNAEVEIFYDDDRNPDNGVNVFYATQEDPDGPADATMWDTTGLAAGLYYIGGRIRDENNVWYSVYAVGTVTIDTTLLLEQSFTLDAIGSAFKGCVFEGFSFAGYLGRVMAGNFDITGPAGTPDGVPDFIMAAPTADAFYLQEPDVGEAYLILGGAPSQNPSWYNGTRFSVNAVGTVPALPGAIFTGPTFRTSSRGIGSIFPIQDIDGDGGAELIFGIPELVDGLNEDQDYDPPDCLCGGQNCPPFGAGPYAWPFPCPNEIPEDDFHSMYGTITRTGYTAFLGSTTQFINPANGLGWVIPIDEIGQRRLDHDPKPRLLSPQVDATATGIHGMRLYPMAREPFLADFMNNGNLYGMAIGMTDLDGDGQVEWAVAAPRTENVGSIELWWPSSLAVWSGPLPGGEARCFSYPYTDTYRTFIWPILDDRIIGDIVEGAGGELSNPLGLADVNLDGLGELAVSAPKASPNQLAEAGAAYLIFGRAPFGDFRVSDIKLPVAQEAQPGIMITGTVAGDRLGQQMATTGTPNYTLPNSPRLRDFNNDGLADWVISLPGRDVQGRADVGAIAIVFGNPRRDGRYTLDHIGTEDLPGVIITGANQGDEFGTYLVNGGDINGDGADDLLVAAPGAENPLTGEQDTGAIYVIYGPPQGGDAVGYQTLSGTHSITDLMENGPVKVRVFYGAHAGHRIGPVAAAGDLDGDGFGEFLVGDPLAAPLGRTDAGEVYVVFGSDY